MKKFTLIHRGDKHSQDVCKQIKDRLQANGMEYEDENPELII